MKVKILTNDANVVKFNEKLALLYDATRVISWRVEGYLRGSYMPYKSGHLTKSFNLNSNVNIVSFTHKLFQNIVLEFHIKNVNLDKSVIDIDIGGNIVSVNKLPANKLQLSIDRKNIHNSRLIVKDSKTSIQSIFDKLNKESDKWAIGEYTYVGLDIGSTTPVTFGIWNSISKKFISIRVNSKKLFSSVYNLLISKQEYKSLLQNIYNIAKQMNGSNDNETKDLIFRVVNFNELINSLVKSVYNDIKNKNSYNRYFENLYSLFTHLQEKFFINLDLSNQNMRLPFLIADPRKITNINKQVIVNFESFVKYIALLIVRDIHFKIFVHIIREHGYRYIVFPEYLSNYYIYQILNSRYGVKKIIKLKDNAILLNRTDEILYILDKQLLDAIVNSVNQYILDNFFDVLNKSSLYHFQV